LRQPQKDVAEDSWTSPKGKFAGFGKSVVADNPIGESSYYSDGKKWLVRSPERRLMRSDALHYYDGEE
jgi:hypothetical protein